LNIGPTVYAGLNEIEGLVDQRVVGIVLANVERLLGFTVGKACLRSNAMVIDVDRTTVRIL
jgi:hypothetical protein